jgi:hypothetical protein
MAALALLISLYEEIIGWVTQCTLFNDLLRAGNDHMTTQAREELARVLKHFD